MLDKIQQVLWPIKKSELKKFMPMAFLLFFILFNYNALRSLKDSLIVPNIGAESISFLKLYFVVPSAILFTLVYAKLTSLITFQKIFYCISVFFLTFFLVFAFVLYPNQEYFHPDAAHIQTIISSSYDLGFITIKMEHLKWFILIVGKWPFALFYIFAELWGAAMIFLMFWQFANQTTATEEAKRFYPMFGLIGHVGPVVSGALVKYFSQNSHEFFEDADLGLIRIFMLLTSTALICAMLIFRHINKDTKVRSSSSKAKKAEEIRPNLPMLEGFKLIFSSKYLGYIVILVFSYGIAINLVEGPWKAKLGEMYSNTKDYAYFMGHLSQINGALSMVMMVVGANILRIYGWYVGALITPLIILFTGVGFFSFLVFGNFFAGFYAGGFFDPLLWAVILGTAQNVMSKSTKYSLFDSTKEMTYIPANAEIRSKGKAAVDVVGARLAKSGGAFVQTLLFIIFPSATFEAITPFLMIIFIIVLFVWLWNLKVLRVAYEELLRAKESKS